ncbi:MBL fold metallo-hydrolase [Plantibacter sp. Leaf314]|uniref:MBL fold metallo-hydrolase n=1 Tax=Plantibacter sp. Leaf314 TaxID=1736333 RepID=UPI0007015745|nr:MBL fold metallo-hydrolase [Plantibacter sp. Leaf314]KQQ52078.1 hypothetical protein ASF68_06785 [Plantibacter sp. Leaf314]
MITSSSESQAAAFREGRTPPTEQLDADTVVIAVPTTDPGNPFTLCSVLFGTDGRAIVVDPGTDTPEGREHLLRELRDVGVTTLTGIVVTHLHPDHLGLAGVLREELAAPVLMHRLEDEAAGSTPPGPAELAAALDAWGVPADDTTVRPWSEGAAAPAGHLGDTRADRTLEDGELLALPGRTVRVIHTPGHTTGHLTLRDEDRGYLFTGDHVLPTIFSGLGLGARTAENPVTAYLSSLDRVRGHDGDQVIPGHGFRFTGLAERCDELAAHHLRRADEVRSVLADDPDADVWTIASRIGWSAGWDALTGLLRVSALTQTDWHRARLLQLAG